MWISTRHLPTNPGDYYIVVEREPDDVPCAAGEMWWSFDGNVWLNGWDIGRDIYRYNNTVVRPLGDMNNQYIPKPDTIMDRLQRFKEKKHALDTPK